MDPSRRKRVLRLMQANLSMDSRTSLNKTELVSPHTLARGKYLALASLIGLGLAGVWHSAQSDFDFRIDHGAINQPHRVLIYAYGDQGLATWLDQQVLTHGRYEFRHDTSAVHFEGTQRQPTFAEPSPEGSLNLDQILEEADAQGFGYVALDLKGPQSKKTRDFLSQAAPALEIPQASRWAVIRSDRRINNLTVSFGEVQAGIEFSQQAKARSSLMQALFADNVLFGLYSSDQTIRIESADDLTQLPIAKRGLDFRTIAWQPISFSALSQHTIDEWPQHLNNARPEDQKRPHWLAAPMQQVDAVALNQDTLVLKTAQLAWTSREGTRAVLKSRAPSHGWQLSISVRDEGRLRSVHCDGVSNTRAFAVRTSLEGDAIEIRRPDNAHEIFAISIDPTGACNAELKSRTLAGNEPLVLGLPQANGFSSWLASGSRNTTLTWRSHSKLDRLRLEDRQFVRDRWIWLNDHTLRALTVHPDDPENWQLEDIHLDPNRPEGFYREPVETNGQEPSEFIPSTPRWAELSYETKAYFGARIPQATLVSVLENGEDTARTTRR